VLLLLLFLGLALAQEEILDFHADLRLEQTNRVVAHETLVVRAEGLRIRHGIYRDLWLRRPGGGLGLVGRLKFLGARLNGQPVPYRLERRLGAVRVYLGDPERTLPPGLYTFELSYALGGVVDAKGVFAWNVTGNDWAFPIRQMKARLAPPPGVRPLEARAYVGPFLSQKTLPLTWDGEAYRVQAQNLAPGEGVTLWVRFPPGVFRGGQTVPVETSAGLLLLFGLLGFFIWSHDRLGRDPKGPPLIPRFSPPKGVSAALARLILRGEADDRAFSAGILDLAARGYLTLEPGRAPVVKKQPKALSDRLPAELRALFGALPRVLPLSRQHAKEVRTAYSALKRGLEMEKPKYLKENAPPVLVGLGLTSLYLAWLAYRLSGDFGVAVFAAVGALLYTAIGAAVIKSAALAWERYHRIPGVGPVKELFTLLFAGLYFAIGLALVYALLWPVGGVLLGLAGAGLLAVTALFAYLMPAYTEEGARLRTHLLGLARYLAITEADELQRLKAPEDTPERLARLLPYAVALGVEAPFAKRLMRVLKTASEAELARSFYWYGPSRLGGAADPATLARLPSLVGTQLTRSVQAALAQGSGGSGGISSGGFSGGGAGGGGGGGW